MDDLKCAWNWLTTDKISKLENKLYKLQTWKYDSSNHGRVSKELNTNTWTLLLNKFNMDLSTLNKIISSQPPNVCNGATFVFPVSPSSFRRSHRTNSMQVLSKTLSCSKIVKRRHSNYNSGIFHGSLGVMDLPSVIRTSLFYPDSPSTALYQYWWY